MLCGGTCDDDNRPLPGLEKKNPVSVRNLIAGVKPHTAAPRCPVFWCPTETWQIGFQTCRLLYGPARSPTAEREVVGKVVLFTHFMLSWTRWRFPVEIQVLSRTKSSASSLLFLSTVEPALAALAPAPAPPAARPGWRARVVRALPGPLGGSACRWVAR